jgi:outer membrane lipopolysaccharide assembly protein LptE/RlpB
MKKITFNSDSRNPKMLSAATIAALICLCLAPLQGCGYKFVGGGNMPAGVKSVCVSLFENRTAETGLERTITGNLNYEFTRNGIKVMANPDKADARLTGTIKAVTVETVSYRGDQTSTESRVTVVVDARLKNKEGVEIWAADNVSERQTYTADTDKQTSVRNKKSALATLSQRLAESFYGRLTEDF